MGLAQIFSSRAKEEILSALALADGPVSLREICYRTGLYERSAQLALKALIEEGIVSREEGPYRVGLTLNKQHMLSQTICSMFSKLTTEKIEARAKEEGDIAKKAFSLLEELHSFSVGVRRSNEV